MDSLLLKQTCIILISLLGLWCMVWKSDEVEIVAKSRIGWDV